jgi:hypothetical protein
MRIDWFVAEGESDEEYHEHQWIEQHMGGVTNKLNPALRSVEYAMQRGEVVLRRKPVESR